MIQVAARQRTLAERYVEEILLVRAGRQADPTYTAGVLDASAAALLEGGKVPAVNGDDDETTLSPADGHVLRAQFVQEQHLAADLDRDRGSRAASQADGEPSRNRARARQHGSNRSCVFACLPH